MSIESVLPYATLTGIGFAVIGTVWRMTADVRKNFNSKVAVSTCKIIHSNVDTQFADLKNHIDRRFDDIKDLIDATQKR